MVESGYFAVALPKLDIMAVGKVFRLFHGFVIIGADQWNYIVETVVTVDQINSIFCHGARSGGSTTLSVTDECHMRCGDAFRLIYHAFGSRLESGFRYAELQKWNFTDA